MIESHSSRPITITQIVGVMALALIVFLIIAFAGKAVSTYRLRAWRNELQSELAAMDLERQNLLLEIERRQSLAWIDEALKETGQVPQGVTAVRLVNTGGSSDAFQSSASEPAQQSLTERVQSLSYFDNPNWRAWVRLLLNRD